jgi:hypothetical protein
MMDPIICIEGALLFTVCVYTTGRFVRGSRQYSDINEARAALLLILVAAVLTATPAQSYDAVTEAASILRGEAPHDCRRCRELTACALVRDMARAVRLRSRWYGWRAARPQDRALIEAAQDGEMCKQYPACRFVGNGRDLEVWARRGWTGSGRVVAYCGRAGCSVCVPVVSVGEVAE